MDVEGDEDDEGEKDVGSSFDKKKKYGKDNLKDGNKHGFIANKRQKIEGGGRGYYYF